jgi:acyl-coenzyme A synthetase/AMP-(fatty) acid ligase/thioesterase domain-containing protein/acyl carrier protein
MYRFDPLPSNSDPGPPFGDRWLESTLHERFEHVADVQPDAEAIRTTAGDMTFDQLNLAANRVAHAILGRRGSEPGTVAMLLPHDSSQIISTLGILKAGKRYLSLDPTYPVAALTEILHHSQTELLISDPSTSKSAQAIERVGPECAEFARLAEGGQGANPELPLAPDHGAALFYTSGTTGEPKGVLYDHRLSLFRVLKDHEIYAFGREDRVGWLFMNSFAASQGTLFSGLLSGAAVCPYDLRREGLRALGHWLRQREITVLNPPLAVLRRFVHSRSPPVLVPDLRLLILGGESLYRSDVMAIRKTLVGPYTIAHQFASTEASITARLLVPPSLDPPDVVLPAGRVEAGKEIWILNEQGDRLPPGEVGEIAVRSRFLATELRVDPTLTSKRFWADPDGGAERIYLTGDLGSLDSEGMLRHHGRKDLQLKIRGHRVVPRVVEADLMAHEEIEQAVAIAEEVGAGEQRLLAFVTLVQDAEVDPSSLRSLALRHLPEHMVPDSILVVNDLPLTSTGKIDRQRLANLDYAQPRGTPTSPELLDPLNATLLKIWEKTLRIPAIRPDEDFFDLGGHSLLALSLFDEIESEFGVRLPLSSLFRASTISEQAELIVEGGYPRDRSTLSVIHPHGEMPPFYQDRTTFEAEQYLKDLRAFQPHGPYYLGGYSNGGKVALVMATRLLEAGEEVPLVVMIDTYGPGYRKRKRLVTPLIYRWLLQLRRLEMAIGLFRPWLAMHLRSLASLRLRDRFAYIRFKGGKRVQLMRSQVQRFFAPVFNQLVDQIETESRLPPSTYKTHVPSPYPGTVALLRAEKQPLGIVPDPELGWGDLISGKLDVYTVPGFHDSLLFGPRIQFIADLMNSILENANPENVTHST